MTDDELQQYAEQVVRVRHGDQWLSGKLIVGFEAQVAVKAPYAIQWHERSATFGTNEARWVAIPAAEAIDEIEVVDEEAAAKAETEAEADETQTPG